MIDQLLAYYKERQEEIAGPNRGQFVLICSAKPQREIQIIGYYDTVKEAYLYAVEERKFEPGKFLIRECLLPEEESPLTFYSRLR